jgi:hypothetical protein
MGPRAVRDDEERKTMPGMNHDSSGSSSCVYYAIPDPHVQNMNVLKPESSSLPTTYSFCPKTLVQLCMYIFSNFSETRRLHVSFHSSFRSQIASGSPTPSKAPGGSGPLGPICS